MKTIKKIICLCIIATVMCGIVPVAKAQDSILSEALSLIDMSDSELTEVNAAYSAGNYEQAVELYREIFFDRLSEYATKDILTDDITRQQNHADDLLNNYFNRGDDSGKNQRLYMGEVGNYNWFPEAATVGDAYTIYGHRLEWLLSLIGAYIDSGDKTYIRKWLDIYEDFDLHFEEQCAKKGTSWNKQAIEHYRTGPLETLGRGLYRLKGFLAVERYAPGLLKSEMTNEEFCAMLIQQTRDIYNTALTSSIAPNIYTHGITSIYYCYPLYSDIKQIEEKFNTLEIAINNYIEKNYCTDGGDSEHSFNYNFSMINFVYEIGIVMEVLYDEVPEWYAGLKIAARDRLRMLSSVALPDRSMPSISESYSASDMINSCRNYLSKVENDVVSKEILDYIDGISEIAPSFTSIAFPYVGYYIMRDSWEPDSQYMFLKGSRFGSGHHELNALDCLYSAYGERLISSSAATYSETAEYEKYRYYHKSSMGNNTILVDGMNQYRNEGKLSDFSTPQEGVWYTSEFADVASSEFTNGYDEYIFYNTTDASVSDVSHERTILMDKENTLAVVIDNMKTDNAHDYNLVWHLSEKFNSYDSLVANADKKWIKTSLNDNGAGVELYSIYNGALKYKFWCGEELEGEENPNKVKGWWLSKYGTDFKPSLHIETYFDSAKSNKIATLINPTINSTSNIKSVKTSNNGFEAEMKNGTKVSFSMSNESINSLTLGDISANADYLYITKNSSGYIRGIASGVTQISYKNNLCDVDGKKYFDFEISDGQFKIISDIQAPEGFEWVDNTGIANVPDYGY